MARSKLRSTVRVQAFRKKVRDLKASFKYILNIESRDTFSDPGTGFKISKHFIAPKSGIKASNTLILSTISKMKLPERLSTALTAFGTAQVANNVASPKLQILTPRNLPNPDLLSSSSDQMVLE